MSGDLWQFFYGVDWASIRDIDAPFVPHLKSITDTSYFPTDEIDQTNDLPVGAESGDDAKKDLAFLGYTYVTLFYSSFLLFSMSPFPVKLGGVSRDCLAEHGSLSTSPLAHGSPCRLNLSHSLTSLLRRLETVHADDLGSVVTKCSETLCFAIHTLHATTLFYDYACICLSRVTPTPIRSYSYIPIRHTGATTDTDSVLSLITGWRHSPLERG
jgi:hypothetical protein